MRKNIQGSYILNDGELHMDFLKWEREYELGIEDFDAEHRQLVRIINEAATAIDLKKETLVEPLLNQLFEYARVHFSHEERRMTEAGYPGIEAHSAEHQVFFQEVSDLYSRFLKGDPGVAVELTTFLRDWLVTHIQGTDRKYVPYLLTFKGKQG